MSENHQNQITELPYSYHTFLLAFHFDGTFDDRRTGNWKHYSMRDDSYEEVKYKYQIYQYFNTEARKLMFDDESNPRFVYDIPEHLSREYVITKGAETYTLHIDNIKAFVSKHNIAIIQFDLENHEADPDRRNLSYVNRINEYGRRINLPFVVDEGAFHPLVADSVTILGHRVIFDKYGKESIKNYRNENDKDNIIYPVLRLIRELLPDCRNISPIIDDRMFVCCMVRDEALSKKIETKKTVETGDGKEITVDVRDDIFCDETLSNELYAFAFIDAGDSTCQDPVMRESILRRCVYGRWRDWGTIDIITHHSFIRLTGESKGIVDSVINPFLLQYITMAAGVLLQRATILQLSGECTEISEKYFDNKNPTRRSLKQVNEEIKTLKREYVYAQNTVFLEQFTVQEQGVDEFSMMKRELNIDDSLERLEQKINSLYEYTEEYSEEQENKLLNLIAYIGLPLALINLIVDMVGLPVFGENSCMFFLTSPLAVGALVLSVGIVVYAVVRLLVFYIHGKDK